MAYSTRQQAVDALAQMYTFTEAIFDGTKEKLFRIYHGL